MSNPEQLFNKAAQAATQGNFELALVFLGELLSKYPSIAKAHHLSATCLMRMGDYVSAVRHASAAVKIEPNHGPSRWIYGICLARTDRQEEAIPQFRAACDLAPQEPTGWNNLGHALLEARHFHEAEAAFRRGLSLTGTLPQLSVGLAWALLHTGRADQSLEALDWQETHTPGEIGVQYARAIMSLYSARVSADRLAEIHRAYGAKVVEQLPSRPTRPAEPTPADADRPLRVGLLSPDFYGHSVSRFVEPLLLNCDLNRVRFGAFSTHWIRDEISGRLEKLSGLWSRIYTLSDQLAVAEIRKYQVDILIDLAGHMPMNRSHLLAHRPAAITMTYLGYPHSTGYTGIDYRIVDSITDPPGQSERYGTEELLRLDPCFLCFMPAIDPPDVEPLAENGREPIVFGSFNNAAKYSPPLLEMWARILQSVPDSRLLLKSYSLSDAGARAFVVGSLARHGVDPARIELLGQIPSTREHLATYGRVHIALDTFPYHGTTTTCEAMLMGVPVISLVGDEHRSRVGASLLSAVGVKELLANSPDEYVAHAKSLAADRKRLVEYRSSLRQRMAASPLMDGIGFFDRFEKLLRDVWRKRCNGG